jgi:hypothetical protein
MTTRRIIIGLAACSFFGATIAEAAFWNRRKKAESDEVPPVETAAPEAVPVTLNGSPNAMVPVRAEPTQIHSYNKPVPLSAKMPASSGPLSGTGSRRAHISIPDDQTEQILVQLAESRQLREEEIRVLGRLHVEKEGELERMNQRLMDGYGIAADQNYQYDQETRTLFKLELKEGVDPDGPVPEGATAGDLFDKIGPVTLATPDAESEFLRLVSAKKITASELQVVELLLKEKNMELQKVYSSLKERFAISPKKHYEYDPEAHTLFEVVKAGREPAEIQRTSP